MKQIVNGIEVEMTQEEIAAVESQRQSAIAEMSIDSYKSSRAQAYPSIADQLDTIYHSGIDAWKAQIAAVKQEYPKP